MEEPEEVHVQLAVAAWVVALLGRVSLTDAAAGLEKTDWKVGREPRVSPWVGSTFCYCL